MTFIVKDWKDSPSTDTPLDAAALEDMEARLSAYTDASVADIALTPGPQGPAGPAGADGAAGAQGLAGPRPATTDPADVNLLSWAYDPANATAASVPVAGTAYWVRLPVRQTIAVTNVVLVISTPGTGATPLANCYAALFDAAGNRRGVTAEQSSNWAGGVTKIMPLIVDGGQSLTIQGSDGYCFASFVVGTQSTTTLQFFRSGSSAGPGQLGLTGSTTPPMRFMTKAGFATGLPTSIAYSTCSVSSVLWWAGIS